MPEEVKLWRISDSDELKEVRTSILNLESRLETWIEKDISILDPELLVIGRQVETDFNGVIDLLCLNSSGDTTIVELKKDKTPREITAQILDYASWVKDLTYNKIISIFKKYSNGKLEEAFVNKFNIELPENLNENHSMLIIGSNIDTSSERIIKYLSDTYGVDINAASFTYYKDDNDEFLSKLFLIEPEEAEYNTRTKSTSKRRPNLTFDELEDIAKKNNVYELFHYFVDHLSNTFKKHTTISSIVFTTELNGSKKAIISLLPYESNQEMGLSYQLYFNRLCNLLHIENDKAKTYLPNNSEDWIYYKNAGEDFSGYSGSFTNKEEIDSFLKLLK